MSASTASLAIFTIVKPRTSRHLDTIQRNAIGSWLALPGPPDIVVFGDRSTEELGEDLGVRHVSDFAYSEHGAPLLNSVFPLAESLTTAPNLAYANADILLLPDFTAAVTRVAAWRERYLLVGARCDLDLKDPFTFEPGWDVALRILVRENGRPHPRAGSDYFAFPRGFWGELPPFALGRSAFDNWLISSSRRRGDAVVDASNAVLAVHQDHDYAHIGGVEATGSNADARRNYELAGGDAGIYLLDDASHVLTRWGPLPSVRAHRLVRALGHRLRRHSRPAVVHPVDRATEASHRRGRHNAPEESA